MFTELIQRLDFAWTARIMAFTMVGIYTVSFPLVLWSATNTGDISNGAHRILFDKAAATDVPFWTFTIAMSMISMVYWVPYYYIPTYMQSHLHQSRSWASYSLIIAQASSIVGRFSAALAASQFGVMLPWVVATLASGTICLVWVSVDSFGPFIGICVLWGEIAAQE